MFNSLLINLKAKTIETSHLNENLIKFFSEILNSKIYENDSGIENIHNFNSIMFENNAED